MSDLQEKLDNLTNPNLIEDILKDLEVYRLEHLGYSDWYIWKIWLKGW